MRKSIFIIEYEQTGKYGEDGFFAGTYDEYFLTEKEAEDFYTKNPKPIISSAFDDTAYNVKELKPIKKNPLSKCSATTTF